MQRSLTVIHALGMMLIMFSVTYILPICTSLIYQDGTLIDFALAMVMTFAVGCLMWMLTRHNKGELSIRHGYLLVVMMWTAIPAFATLPLLLNAAWLSRCRVHYWGDIDTHGFAILDQLRGQFDHVKSFLMDRNTLLAFEPLWVEEEKQTLRDLPRLTSEERTLYNDLRDNRIREKLRLEQERIGFHWVESALSALT